MEKQWHFPNSRIVERSKYYKVSDSYGKTHLVVKQSNMTVDKFYNEILGDHIRKSPTKRTSGYILYGFLVFVLRIHANLPVKFTYYFVPILRKLFSQRFQYLV